MATISPTFKRGGGIETVTWSTMTTSDTGDVIDISRLKDLTFHNVGSGTAQLQRSNDGTNWVSWGAALAANTINDQAATSAKLLKISAVATATVTVILTAHKLFP